MRSSSAVPRIGTTESDRQICRDADEDVGDVLTDIAKRVLWPVNTAPELAAACGCSVRQAERFLGGHCEWSGDAVAAIVQEIMRRRRVRNVKVVKRQ